MFESKKYILSVTEFKHWIEADKPIHLIDVRHLEDINEGVIEGKEHFVFEHVPYQSITKQEGSCHLVQATKDYFTERKFEPKGTVVVVCWKGVCAQKIAKGIRALGIDAFCLEGGMDGYRGN